MKKIKDIVLDEFENKSSSHSPKKTLSGPNTNFSPNPLKTKFLVGDTVIAKCSDEIFRVGEISGIINVMGEITYTVILAYHHDRKIIETSVVK